jgi:hypothetical protein
VNDGAGTVFNADPVAIRGGAIEELDRDHAAIPIARVRPQLEVHRGKEDRGETAIAWQANEHFFGVIKSPALV